MKKITFVIGIMGNGGAERVISILSDIFADKGYQISIITVYGDKLDYKLNPKVEYIPIECKSCRRLLRWIERCVKLRKHFKTQKPDIVISFLADVNIYTLTAALFSKTRVIVSERNDPSQDPGSDVIRKVRNVIYRRADGLVYQTADAEKYFEYLGKKGAIIPNPIKSVLPEPYQGVRDEEIVTACRLSHQKNLKMLIDAFGYLQNIHKDYKLTIYGEGPLRKELEQYIEEKDLTLKVFLPGFSNNIHNDILKVKIFAMSSNYEGISNSMLEALALGIPVVVTDCPVGGARMFIEDGINGVLVNVDDTKAMEDAMLRIIEDDAFAAKLSANSVAIRSYLSADIIANMWLEFIDPKGPVGLSKE